MSLHDLDFTQQAPRRMRLATPLLAAALVFWLAIGWQALSLREDARLAQNRLVRAQTRHAALAIAPTRQALPIAQTLALRNAIDALNVPWPDLFEQLDQGSAQTPVALLSIEPDANMRLLRGEVEAASAADMLAYLNALRAGKVFTRVQLRSHTLNEKIPQQPWRFQFEAEWSS